MQLPNIKIEYTTFVKRDQIFANKGVNIARDEDQNK